MILLNVHFDFAIIRYFFLKDYPLLYQDIILAQNFANLCFRQYNSATGDP